VPRIVILGTGTGVGKTYVTSLLVRALATAAPGRSVVAVKPVETGVTRARGGAPAPGSDAALLEAASSGPTLRPHPLHALPAAVSPHLAARQRRAAISLPRIQRWLGLSPGSDATLHDMWQLVETAGGAFSPLSARLTNADLALRLEPSIWILVAPDALGVLHDVRATLLALKAVARAPDHLVLSACRAPDASVGTNARELERVGLPRPIVAVARGASPASLGPLVRALLAHPTPRRPR
jgi:dethiobiotin synthetase